MQRKRCLIQVPLELDSRRVDKVLVVRGVLHRVLVEMRRRPQRPQIEIHNPIRLGQQPRRFRRCLFAEVNRPSQQQQDDQHYGDG